MDIFIQPSEAGVKRLLKASQLDSSDLTPEHLRHFFGLGPEGELEGVVGLELFGAVALLRSLAVVPSRRRVGLGTKLVAHAEDYARGLGIKSLYLLTNTAESFFKHRAERCSLGNQRDKRVFRDLPGEFGIHGKASVTNY
jgi:amino-acid N-acetyltransferase